MPKEEINQQESKQQHNAENNLKPSVSLNGHYIKELSIDNSNSPTSFLHQNERPKIEVSVNFDNRNIRENIYEVVLVIKARAKSEESSVDLFDVKLTYGVLATLNNFTDDKQKEEILMIYLPNLLFPYARRVISDATSDSGFQPLLLEHIDFSSLYNQRKNELNDGSKQSDN